MDPLDDALEGDLGENPSSDDNHPMHAVRAVFAVAVPDVVRDAAKDGVLAALGLTRAPTLRRFGRYIVLGVLGEGGMGTVLKAYDDDLDRQIALKLLHSNVTERQTRRLWREAQALARLDHPNVVKVFEVGEAEGQTFVAMQLIKGMTLEAWQKHEPRPGWKECVGVYVQAGRGLAAAHEAGLVHRDFKPSNCIIDEKGRVQVLDFGLARGAELPDSNSSREHTEAVPGPRDAVLRSSLTNTGQALGTPAYMSPEQLAGRATDARSDQFSFCVSLYEAVYGRRPFDGATPTELAASIHQARVQPSSKGRHIPGDLRDFLARGLAADPLLRWRSMDELLARLQQLVAPRSRRWLALGLAFGMTAIGLGITRYAQVGFRCKGSAAEFEGVWNEGRRREVRAALLGTKLPYASGVWAWAEPRLDRYADTWIGHHRDACEATSVRQEQSAAMMDLRMACLHRATVEFNAAVEVLATADKTVTENAHVLIENLQPPSRCSDLEALQAEVEPPPAQDADAVELARAHIAESAAQRNAGRYAAAQVSLEAAKLSLQGVDYEPVYAELHLEEGQLLNKLGLYENSEARLREALAVASKWRQFEKMQQAATLLIGVVGYQRHHIEEALRYRELAVGLATGDPTRQAVARLSLANLLDAQGRYHDAETEFRTILSTLLQTPESNLVNIAIARNSLANALQAQARHEEAALEHQQALRLWTEQLGPEHPHVLHAQLCITTLLSAQGKFADAEEGYRKILPRLGRSLGNRHPTVARTLNHLANTLNDRGNYEEAEAVQRQSLALLMEALGPDHSDIAESRADLASTLVDRRKYEEARSEYQMALAVFAKTLGPKHPDTLGARMNATGVLYVQGKYEEAEQEFRLALPLLEEVRGKTHPSVATLRGNLANSLLEQGKVDEAEHEQRLALALRERALGSNHPDVALSRMSVAGVFHEQGKYADAEVELRQAVSIWEKSLGADHLYVLHARNNLAAAQAEQGEYAEAELEIRRVLIALDRTLSPNHPDIAESRRNLATILLKQGKAQEALPLARQSWERHQQGDVPIQVRAETAFVFAQALWIKRDQRAQARAVAELARVAYAELGPSHEKMLAEVDAWLRTHRAT